MRARASLPLISLVFSCLVLPAEAVVFSDVPATHRFRVHIEELASMQVVTGNPDGTFRPDAPVNRAAMLTMLYRAKGWKPAAPSAACGKDVVKGGWYEAVVCDALAKGYVSGYGDGWFRPEQTVTRAEALKMTLVILGLPVSSAQANGYGDVRTSDWFAAYVTSALKADLIPLPGDSQSVFGPNVALTRGEAAAYVYGGILSSRAAQASSAAAASQGARRSQGQTTGGVTPEVSDVSLPFSDDGTFAGKRASLYRFTLRGKAVTRIEASVTTGTLSCRLFRLEADGTSQEYYLGDEHGQTCALRVSLAPGSYQLDLKPTKGDAGYSVETSAVAGDGNDGFSEAKVLSKGKTLSDAIGEGDTADWYTFTMTSKGTRTVGMSEAGLGCLVYPMRDVDLFGFDNPECGIPFEYPAGTYYVGVMRGDGQESRDYSVWLE